MKTTTMQFQARQGDVLVMAEEMPKGAQQEMLEAGRIVLAHGEATGHAHAIRSQHATPFALPDKRRFVLIQGGRAMLKHDEHGAVKVPPGTYRVVRQREWQDEEIRNVED
jgi:hypothetical protein